MRALSIFFSPQKTSRKRSSRNNRRLRTSSTARLRIETLEPRVLLATLPLLGQSDLEFLGSFRVPQQTVAGSTFAYGGTAPAYNAENHSLFLVGHDHHQQIAEISIPDLVNSANKDDLNTATFLQPFQNIQGSIPNFSLNSPSKIGGLEVTDGKLTGTFYEYYDGDYSGADSHFQLSSTDLGTSSVNGLFRVGSQGGGFVGGYMAKVPDAWQDELGMPYITGQAGLAIVGRTSAGPSAFGFDPSTLTSGNSATTEFLRYPHTQPLAPVESTNPLFNLTTEVTGVVFPENSSSVIFFGSHGTGTYCYGSPTTCDDPYRGGNGTHARGGEYEYQAWAYDVNEFIAVKNGLKEAWEVQPYDVWTFDLPIDDNAKHIGGVSYDSETGRLYVAQRNADFSGSPYPIVNVFQLPTSASPSDPADPAPAISNVNITAVAKSSATVSWSTAIPANSRIEYGTTTNSLGNTTTSGGSATTAHSASLTGLQPSTEYFFRIVSVSTRGVESTSDIAMFKTTAAQDPDPGNDGAGFSFNTPPSLPPIDPASTINVSTVGQLVSAVGNLKSGQTISISPGTYNLTGTADALYIPQGISDWSIRGQTGDRRDVTIRGDGMNGSVRFGFWIGNSSGGTIADITISDIREHGVIANPGADDMLFHGLRILDIGDQFIKSNPASNGSGNDRGMVQYSIFEYRTAAPDDYTNAIDVHAGDRWNIRQNLFKNFISSQGLAGPAILIWNGSTNTTVDGNTFINNARGIALGLLNKSNGLDHAGGTIINNMFYRGSTLSGSLDVPIAIADSPGTKIWHNTVLDESNYPNSIEYRFGSTTNVDIRNNLLNQSITARDGASGTINNNATSATESLFVNPSLGDLHLRDTADIAIDRGQVILELNHDIDGQSRDATPDLGADEYGSLSPDVADPNPVTPVSHFSFSEGRGYKTLDHVGHSARIGGARWTSGISGKGLRFDGRNDTVTVDDHNDLTLTDEFTLSMWVKPSRVTGWQTGILKQGSNGLAYGLYVSNDQSLPVASINIGGSTISATANQSLPTRTWSHLAATWDGNQLILFVDGAIVSQVSASGQLVQSNSPLQIGGNRESGEYFKGTIDEVSVLDRALSAAELGDVMQSTRDGTWDAVLPPSGSATGGGDSDPDPGTPTSPTLSGSRPVYYFDADSGTYASTNTTTTQNLSYQSLDALMARYSPIYRLR